MFLPLTIKNKIKKTNLHFCTCFQYKPMINCKQTLPFLQPASGSKLKLSVCDRAYQKIKMCFG